MTEAVSTKGIQLAVELESEWNFFHEVKTTPEIGTSSGKIDATSLESEIKEYIKDIPDWSSDLSFTMNAMPASATGSNLALIERLTANGVYSWKVLYPLLGREVVLTGEWSWALGAGSVSAVQEIILSIIPRSKPLVTPITGSYTLSYDANGGTGTMTDDTEYAAGTFATAKANIFTRSDYNFVAWNTADDGTGASYDEGDSVVMIGDTTLYAIWAE
jgi:hypothetical protein